MLAQDYPAYRLEVLVAGMSDDGTRAFVGEIARRDPRVRLVDNQAGIMAAGFNAALRFARGEIIVLLGGHSEVAVDFVRESVGPPQENVRKLGALADRFRMWLIACLARRWPRLCHIGWA